MVVTYEWEFVKVVIRRSTYNLHHVDFMYYKPLNSPPSGMLFCLCGIVGFVNVSLQSLGIQNFRVIHCG